MDASSITRRKNNGALYTSYINQVIPPVSAANTTIFSNPNTEPCVFQYFTDSSGTKYTNAIQYGVDNFMTFQLKYDVLNGGKSCGNHVISTFNTQEEASRVSPYVCPESKLKFTTGPTVICPNIEFSQGTNFTNECNNNECDC